jgi:hypothetical protein
MRIHRFRSAANARASQPRGHIDTFPYRPQPLARPLPYPQTDDPVTVENAADLVGASSGGSLAALMSPRSLSQSSGSPDTSIGWSPFFASPSAAPAPAPSLKDALDALAAILNGGAPSSSSIPAGIANQTPLQSSAQRGADSSSPLPESTAPISTSPASSQIAHVDRARKDYCVALCTKLVLLPPGPSLSRQTPFERCLAHCEGRSFWPQFESRIPFPG